jgi:zinc/manganese transport system permease protein
MSMLSFMAAPFAACLVLVGIHAYFGMHVIERRVLFVTLYSMGFATLAAMLFALTRVRDPKLPQEAIIGVTFVIASAAAILVADRAPEGAEHLKESLAGSLLWVTWPTVAKDLVIYTAIGAFHWLLRHRFMLITTNPDEAYRRGWKVVWWDFLFYLSFGITITFSVEIGGILMVFAYLVIPACIAILTATAMRARLIIGWIVGILGSILGLVASYSLDLPTGPAIVVVLGLMLAVVWTVFRGRQRREALSNGP